MRILSILARHGRETHPGALDDLRAFQRTRLPTSRCDLLVVDNAGLDGGPRPGEPELLAGSGRSREFSAWDEGLAHAGPRLWEYDLVHLVTSAFGALYTRYIERCDERTLALALRGGVAVGHLDYYDRPIELLGCRSQCWLRSSFVFLPPAEVATLGPLSALDRAAFFSGDPAAPFRPDAPLSAQYQRYIVDWLTGPGTGQGTVWHSRFALAPETLPAFEAKALAILHEHLFTIRLRRQGCAVADATWLATRAARGLRGGGALAVAGWREQLAGRDTDAIQVPASAA